MAKREMGARFYRCLEELTIAILVWNVVLVAVAIFALWSM